MIRMDRSAIVAKTGCYLGVSYAALAMASPAMAQCVPNPPVEFGITECTGTESGGLAVNALGAIVNVQAGATVNAPSPTSSAIVSSGRFVTINVDGTINGGSNGILFEGGGNAWNVSVNPNGIINGATGISIRQFASVDLVNAGQITGRSGIALGGDPATFGSFRAIDNLATGRIGSIYSYFNSLNNAGLIDGGSLSAIQATGFFQIRNSGTISSSNNIATINNIETNGFAGRLIENLGADARILNTGSGAALLITNPVVINNFAGTIGSSGPTAIQVNGGLILDNRDNGGQYSNAGTINGSVVVTYGDSRIELFGGGRINGDLILGNDTNIVRTDYGSAASPFAGVSGNIVGGTGDDTIVVGFANGASLNSSLNTPTNFETLNFLIGSNQTVTLEDGFSTNTTIGVVPQGDSFNGSYFSYYTPGVSLINNTSLNTTYTAIEVAVTDSQPTIINNGTINAALTQPDSYALSVLGGYGDFQNTGTINATTGGGVSLIANGTVTSSNSGSIIADATALYIDAISHNNSGTIRSNAGIGVVIARPLYQSFSQTPFINSGTIEGATAGFQMINGYLINSGTITGGTVGVNANSGTIDNRSGGVINGGIATGSGRVVLLNSGTVNGNVRLAGTYFDFAGGRINGDLDLVNGTYVTPISNLDGNPFANISGTVTGAGFDRIQYIVSTDTSATLANATGIFDSVGFHLENGANLVLNAPTAVTQPVTLFGSGTVDLTADINYGLNRNILLVARWRQSPRARQPLTISMSSAEGL
ncbi:MAG: hypothetical protein HC843_04700 [Sphingomonadales bacterium]|nr:hypothetical protein [Sphingomonadales bacterium]